MDERDDAPRAGTDDGSNVVRDADGGLARGFSLTLGGGLSELTVHSEEGQGWRFRQAMARWASSVAVILVRSDATIDGLTISALCSVSLEPTLVLTAIAEGTHALPALLRGRYTINLLAAGQRSIAEDFAAKASLTALPPLLEDDVIVGALAALVCVPWQDYPAGDHRLVVGAVERIWLGADVDPLLYHEHRYRTLAPDDTPPDA